MPATSLGVSGGGGLVAPPVGLRLPTPLACVAEGGIQLLAPTTPLATGEAAALPAGACQNHRPHDCQVGVHTDLGGVPFMEDAHHVHTARGEATVGIYDGHGGPHAVNYVLEHLHRHIGTALEGGLAPTEALLSGFAQTEAGLVGEQREQLCLTSAMCGATATVALLRDCALHVAWLGDCRAVLCRGGDALNLTHDHVLVGEGSCGEFLRVMSEGGHVEGGRLSGFLEVSRSLGDVDPRTGGKPAGLSSTPEICSQELQPEDEFVIVASDGLWRLVDSQAAVRLARADLRAHANVDMAAEKLVEEARNTRRADDNITVGVLLLRPVEPDMSPGQRPKLQLMRRGASFPSSLLQAASSASVPSSPFIHA